MHRVATSVKVAILLLLTAGCSHREVIPDDTLADIFHDAFLTNAYITERRVDVDSIDVYREIFRKYGYSESDFMYTIGNFSRRKSAQLGKILGMVTERLSNESGIYKRQVVILDTIREVSIRRSERVLVSDSLIKVRRMTDTARLIRRITVPGAGKVTIRYEYQFEEDPVEDPRRIEIYRISRDGIRRNDYSARLRREDSFERRMEVAASDSTVEIRFANLEDKSRKRKKNSLEIRNLDIRFYRDEQYAVDSLFHAMADVMLLATDERNEKDSL